MLTIFRGEDLPFAEYNRKVCVKFNTCQDLTGWAAKFYLLDNVKETQDISSRLWAFSYTAEETKVFPLGWTFGKLAIYDATGKIRQLAKVEVNVVNQRPEPCMDGFIAISIDNVVSDYTYIGNKPSLNGKTIEGIHDSAYYELAPASLVEQHQALAQTIQVMSSTVSDQGDAIADNYVQLVALKDRVDRIAPSTDYSQQIADLSNRINAEVQARTSADAAEVVARNAAIADAVEVEATARDAAITSLVSGETPITKLLFKAEGDESNYYRIQVVMRDDGHGNLVPALALDAVPRASVASNVEGA